MAGYKQYGETCSEYPREHLSAGTVYSSGSHKVNSNVCATCGAPTELIGLLCKGSTTHRGVSGLSMGCYECGGPMKSVKSPILVSSQGGIGFAASNQNNEFVVLNQDDLS